MAKQRTKPTRRREKKGGPGSGRRKPCPYCKDKIEQADYKDVEALRRFISEKGKIRSRRITGACRRHQSQIARAVKRARELALLPYVNEAAGRVVDRALALSGGAGYLNGSTLARAYRDVRAGSFMHPLGANRAYDYLACVAIGQPATLH